MKDVKAKGQIQPRPTVAIRLTTDVKEAVARLGVSAQRIISVTH